MGPDIQIFLSSDTFSVQLSVSVFNLYSPFYNMIISRHSTEAENQGQQNLPFLTGGFKHEQT